MNAFPLATDGKYKSRSISLDADPSAPTEQHNRGTSHASALGEAHFDSLLGRNSVRDRPRRHSKSIESVIQPGRGSDMNSIQRSSRSDSPRIRATRSTLGITLGLCAALMLAADFAAAYPVDVFPSNRDTCDPLGLAGVTATDSVAVDELGTFVFPDNETISSYQAQTDYVACSTSFDPDGYPQVLLSIVNKTGLEFSKVWYVSDPGTLITNVDGIVNGQEAFKIDAVGFNAPLISESGTQPGIFETNETWSFVIDGYQNNLGINAAALASLGVGWDSPNQAGISNRSSGSIIATIVPEPNTALLMVLGLMGLALAGRNRTSLHAMRNRSSLPLALSVFVVLLFGFDHPVTAYSTLTGSGNHLIAPSPNPDPFYTSHTWTNSRIPDPQNTGFLVFNPPLGTTLKTPWQGNFQQTAGSGLGSGNSGLNTFNFAGLNGDPLAPGTLAAESLISINDLDEGGGAGTNEWLKLTAYDPNNSVIQSPWLSTLVEVSGNPNGNSDPLPGWDWNGSSYVFDTQFIGTPNPAMQIRLITLNPIAELHLEKDHVNFSVGFGAQIEPIPEPSTALLLVIGLMGLGAARRQRRARA